MFVGIMVLPFPEVTDVPRAKLCRPSLIRIHNRLVEANRKQHDLPAFTLLFKGLRYLVLYPIALD
jgi:hypothetical protein